MKAITRRQFMQFLGAANLSMTLPNPSIASSINPQPSVISKIIASSGQSICSIGMGTWQTFNVGSDPVLRKQRSLITSLFFQLGGQMIDSSPMYGSSQDVVGYALSKLNYPKQLFSAEKVWTDSSETREQISSTRNKWGVQNFDLMQVHNLRAWEHHLEILKALKAAGEIRYIGITTSHGRRHSELEQIMASEALDFVQLTYNLQDRAVEQRLLPLALEKGIAIIVNRPFQGGRLIKNLQRLNKPLPKIASEIDCSNWAQFLLKFTTSHPAVKCAIPATTKLQHMQENMGAAQGVLPDQKQRKAMLAYFESL